MAANIIDSTAFAQRANAAKIDVYIPATEPVAITVKRIMNQRGDLFLSLNFFTHTVTAMAIHMSDPTPIDFRTNVRVNSMFNATASSMVAIATITRVIRMRMKRLMMISFRRESDFLLLFISNLLSCWTSFCLMLNDFFTIQQAKNKLFKLCISRKISMNRKNNTLVYWLNNKVFSIKSQVFIYYK